MNLFTRCFTFAHHSYGGLHNCQSITILEPRLQHGVRVPSEFVDAFQETNLRPRDLSCLLKAILEF